MLFSVHFFTGNPDVVAPPYAVFVGWIRGTVLYFPLVIDVVGERGFETLSLFLNPVDSVVLTRLAGLKRDEEGAILFPSCSQALRRS
jgi:hypothetical protein